MREETDPARWAGAETVGADWSAYSAQYDLLLQHNPAYQDLIARFERFVEHGPPVHRALDAGGGTGNFSLALLGRRPGAKVTLVEPDAGMRARAGDKLGRGAEIVPLPLEDVPAEGGHDLVICCHALYSMPDPMARLRQLRAMTRPGGLLFIVDFGRQMRVWDWRLYLTGHLLCTVGPGETLRLMRQGREVARQNAAVARAQRAGRYWLHSTAGFATALQQAGWRIRRLDRVYRGYSDLAVCERTDLGGT